MFRFGDCFVTMTTTIFSIPSVSELHSLSFLFVLAVGLVAGTIAIKNSPIEISTACDGSTSSVRAPSAAAGIPVME